ncbi:MULTISPECIES: endonuclease/exonuclease/phosphatase family protein [unclassified Streptomyces]|uniref:endonuclease/exonuclease/phosphatase family protein n=1 Tax=unclassified Streptomyces TaxID=2593676 RepID=UPI002E7FD2C6|nr:endonuclease/exonuclease/phosphatase family protein [Streptomyces sp. NBC_00589]WTI37803.1 endonuclease/exonuclease/phosphatase family protein [Streptomyces sp. NBC_00775]WUB28518.1 endonuclease/exonuclease/phosphatase family protein [Streptomyces sp. NBC_00589]
MDTAAAEWTSAGEPAGARRRAGRTVGAWAAGLLFAGVSVVVGCRAADSDGITPVPQLLAFLPWLLAPTGLGLLLALLARWRVGMVWGVLLLGCVAWFIEPYGKTSEPGGTPLAELRVMTSNVEFGRGTDALIPAVRRQKPDILFVEECEYGCSRALEDAFGGSRGVYPYREAVEGAGSDGSVIMSRFPLTGADGVRGTMGMPGAVADVDGHDVRLQLAHPMPPLPGQLGVWRRELGGLRDYAAASEGPTILAGDFNASQDHAAFRHILDTGLRDGARLTGDARTPSWPARTTPTLGAQIDHVLVSEDFSANRATFLRITGTDHRALVVDVTLHRHE